MPQWIAKARNTVRREVPAEPVPFERACACGEVLSGERDDLAQEIHCVSCGRNWFVLPRDVYPWPKKRKPKASARMRSSLSRWSRRPGKDEAASSAAPLDKSATATSDTPASDRQRSSVGTKPEAKAAPAPTTLAIAPTWPQRVRGGIKRAARPIRLVAGGIAMLIVLTGIWLWYQDRLADAAETLGKAVPVAEAAIDAGDLPRAAQAMGRAAGAVDILGENDKGARRIRQRHRELVAILGLASLTPFDLAAEAALANKNPKRWSSAFAASYAGKWVILDVPLGRGRPATLTRSSLENKPEDDEREPSNGESSEEGKNAPPPAETVIPLLLPLNAGDVPVRFELEPAALGKNVPQERAILALQYKSWTMQKDQAGNPVWVVRFEPRTAFLWASIDLYKAAGFNPDSPTWPAAPQLAKQAKLLKLLTKAEADGNG